MTVKDIAEQLKAGGSGVESYRTRRARLISPGDEPCAVPSPGPTDEERRMDNEHALARLAEAVEYLSQRIVLPVVGGGTETLVSLCKAALARIRALLLSPPKASVTREWFQKLATSIMYHHGTDDPKGIYWPEAKAMLAEKGITVEPSEGEGGGK